MNHALKYYRVEFNPISKKRFGSVLALNAYSMESVEKNLRELIEKDTNCKNIGLSFININRIGDLGRQQYVYEVFNLDKNYQLGTALVTEI
jgi:hypothetical protein